MIKLHITTIYEYITTYWLNDSHKLCRTPLKVRLELNILVFFLKQPDRYLNLIFLKNNSYKTTTDKTLIFRK